MRRILNKMVTSNWFGLSHKEREIATKRLLDSRRSQMRQLANALLNEKFLDEGKEGEIYSRLVEYALDAYMHLDKGNFSEEEWFVMSQLAFARLKFKREIRNELKEEERLLTV